MTMFHVKHLMIGMRQQNKEALENLAHRISFSDRQYQQVFQYVELLEQWSQRVNLFSKNDIDVIVSKHVAESLDFCTFGLVPTRGRMLDLGSGGGFPGIPVKIYHPDLNVLLVDSKRKKSLFLSEVIERLQIDGLESICKRIEELTCVDSHELFDVITARAVAKLSDLWQWGNRFLAQNGFLVTQKGGDLASELQEMKILKNINIRIVKYKKDKKFIVLNKKNYE